MRELYTATADQELFQTHLLRARNVTDCKVKANLLQCSIIKPERFKVAKLQEGDIHVHICMYTHILT